jgi:hypothetical protein
VVAWTTVSPRDASMNASCLLAASEASSAR